MLSKFILVLLLTESLLNCNVLASYVQSSILDCWRRKVNIQVEVNMVGEGSCMSLIFLRFLGGMSFIRDKFECLGWKLLWISLLILSCIVFLGSTESYDNNMWWKASGDLWLWEHCSIGDTRSVGSSSYIQKILKMFKFYGW